MPVAQPSILKSMKNFILHLKLFPFQKGTALSNVFLLATLLPLLFPFSGWVGAAFHIKSTYPPSLPPDFLMCPIDSIGTKLYSWSNCIDNGTDDYLDDYVTIDVIVYLGNDPLPPTGDLEITGPRMIESQATGVGTLVGLDSFIFDDVAFRCDSLKSIPFVITAAFTDDPTCSVTNDSTGYWWPPGPIIPDTSFRVSIPRQCSVCPPYSSPPSLAPPSCWPEESPSTISPCEDYTNYGPDPDFPEHTPIKYIKVVLHIFQQEPPLDPKNYTAEDHMEVIQSWFTDPDGANKQWSNLCPDPGVTPVMTDARLRLVNTGTEGYDVFFHQDNDGWAGSFLKSKYVTNPDSNVVGSEYYWALKDTNILHAQHILIAHNWDDNAHGGYTSGTQFCGDFNSPTSVIYGNYVSFLELENNIPGNDTAALGQQMLGEIYHLLGVDHTSPLQAHYRHDDTPGSGDGCYDTPTGIESLNLTGCNFSAGRCALSQCQIGRMHRFMEKNKPSYERFLVGHDSLGQPIFSRTEGNCYLTDADIVVPSGADILWAGPKSLRSNVVVKSGGKLTVTCDIGIPEGGRFTVEPGARLTIDGAKIYNNCDGTFWHGIEVRGTPGSNQLPYATNGQGYLNMLEGSALQRAEHPVNVKGGGLVRAFSSSFVNCGELYFNPYKPNNFSVFSGCDFTRDNSFDLGQWPDQVQLEGGQPGNLFRL